MKGDENKNKKEDDRVKEDEDKKRLLKIIFTCGPWLPWIESNIKGNKTVR